VELYLRSSIHLYDIAVLVFFSLSISLSLSLSLPAVSCQLKIFSLYCVQYRDCVDCFVLNTQVPWSSKNFVRMYQSARCQIPEGRSFRSHSSWGFCDLITLSFKVPWAPDSRSGLYTWSNATSAPPRPAPPSPPQPPLAHLTPDPGWHSYLYKYLQTRNWRRIYDSSVCMTHTGKVTISCSHIPGQRLFTICCCMNYAGLGLWLARHLTVRPTNT
jgi:hypothetical protein